jgi:hypothetical protein
MLMVMSHIDVRNKRNGPDKPRATFNAGTAAERKYTNPIVGILLVAVK